MRRISLIVVSIVCIISNVHAGDLAARAGRHVADDLTGVFFSWPMVAMLGGGGLSAAVHPLDNKVAHYFENGSKMGKADDVADYMAQFYILDPASLFVFGAGKVFKDEDVALTGEVLLESLLIAQGITGIMKKAADRMRPNGGSLGYPSGHTSNAFSVATALEVLHGPSYGIPAFAIATFIAFARMDSRSHYLSDTVMGAAIGAAAGWGVAAAHLARKPKKVVFYPVTGDKMGFGAFFIF